jgi:hypothetical protein
VDDAGVTGDPLSTLVSFEFTKVGIRVHLDNNVPVKGLQVYMRLKQQTGRLQGEIKFDRARDMNVIMTGLDREVRAVMYNLNNTPIDSGSGVLFRIPLAALDTNAVDSVAIIVSTGDVNLSTILPAQRVAKSTGQYPTSFTLYQNYPNPFNSETFIEYDVPEVVGRVPRVAIQIFNIAGEKVRTIERSDRDAGRYKIRWDGRDDTGSMLASGVYFYRLLSIDPVGGNHFATTKKMIMLK